MSRPVCIVAGVGPGIGAALARRFAADGYAVALIARSRETLSALADSIDGACAFPADLTDAASLRAALGRIEEELGPARVLLYNAGGGSFSSFEDTDPAALEQAFRLCVTGLLRCAQAVAPAMVEAGQGAIVVTGATASLRGGASFAGFAPAKAGQRMLTQSIARKLGPEGVHVAHVIVDGVVDLPRTREWLPDKPDDYFVEPDAVARTVADLVAQPRTAWTFELDLRPYRERW